jgi:Na+/melibiose symporter-like transporter
MDNDDFMEINENKEDKSSRKRYITSLLGMSIIWIAVGFYGETEGQWFNNYVMNSIIGTGYSDTQMSWMVSISALVGTFAFIFWGIKSDNIRTKHGKRTPIFMIGAISTAIFVILFGQGTSLTWLIICDGIIIAITSNMFHCTHKALIPDLFSIEQRAHVNFFKELLTLIGTGCIWVLAFYFKSINEGGAGTFTRPQFEFIFGLCATLLIIAAISAFFIIKEPKDDTPPRKLGQDIKLIFNTQEMKKNKNFMKLFVASLFVIMSQNAYKPWMLRIIDFMEIPDDTTTILIGVIPAVIIAAIVITKYNTLVDKIGRKKSTMLGLIFIPIACIFITFSNYNFIVVIIALGILLSFTLGISISVNTWTQDLLPPESRAKFLGIINIGGAGFQIPGVLLAAYISEAFSVLAIFMVSAIYLILSIPLFLRVPETFRSEKLSKNTHD